MRKIIVNGKFFSAEMTGVHRVALELLKNCHEIIAASPELGKQIELEIWVPRDGAARASASRLPFRVAGPFKGIPWEQFTLPIRAKGRWLLNLCNVGPILTSQAMTMYHDAQVWITPASYSWGFRAWYWLHQSICGRRHQRILTVSDFSRRQLARYGIASENRIGTILNGVDHVTHTRLDTQIVESLALKPGCYVVGLANVQAHKNIGVLLAAFADPLLSDTPLVLFGSATRADFEAKGHAVPPQVRFAGRISDDELHDLYLQAACIAFPSTTEGFGLPPLEAMLMGCPAVVAPEGALPEVCGDAALYADAHDPKAWVRAITSLVDDPALHAEFSRRGKLQAEKFTWHGAANRLIEEILALPA